MSSFPPAGVRSVNNAQSEVFDRCVVLFEVFAGCQRGGTPQQQLPFVLIEGECTSLEGRN